MHAAVSNRLSDKFRTVTASAAMLVVFIEQEWNALMRSAPVFFVPKIEDTRRLSQDERTKLDETGV
ncbi:hypothetical protein PAECIP111893_00573 [Paenibacillus plantiphilus]|uniref:Uncharacterized protein n=1 Tax=Paenibacillus plantiphilus TaxID=2905650 RepID=A0ABN8FYL0_9BACL|nr:hypothetical protein PAECIP111893_00573 [Paenibacillus plantiphilus]